jgi:hypothetical protein
MLGLLHFVLAVLVLPFRSKGRLEAENSVLRHQLIVLRRKLGGRVRLTNSDRWIFIRMYCSITVTVHSTGGLFVGLMAPIAFIM